MKQRPTIKDVAERAGVATATVARVLHNNGYVSDVSRARVLKAVEETGYRINAIARSLKRSQSTVIGHLLQSTVPNPFYVTVARGVESYAQRFGYTALTYNVQGDEMAERRGVDTFLGWRVDAIIFTTPLSAANVERAMGAGIPVIQVERPRTDKSALITVDNYAGAAEAMGHLMELGHKRIAYVGQRPGSQNNRFADYVEEERFGAYRDLMKQKRLYADRLVAFGEAFRLTDQDAHGLGYTATNAWLEADAPPTAIFASSDLLAAGALQSISEHELSVPKDMSVIGFDDTLAPYLAPALTSVYLPANELGIEAAKLALEQIESVEPHRGRALKLSTRLVVRASTGPVRG